MKKLVLSVIIALGLFGTSVSANNLGACTSCHGANFEKKALGKSKIVSDMNQTAIVTALKGYKDDTYGGPMKGVMKGQVARYSNEELEEMAATIQPVK